MPQIVAIKKNPKLRDMVNRSIYASIERSSAMCQENSNICLRRRRRCSEVTGSLFRLRSSFRLFSMNEGK
jgi:hypothetical protein